jgi:pimeloyl-ACP methyl ester carboxylesterase
MRTDSSAPSPVRPRRRRLAVRLLGSLLALGVAAYVGLIGYLMWNETELIFRPQTDNANLAQGYGMTPITVNLRHADGSAGLAWEVLPAAPVTTTAASSPAVSSSPAAASAQSASAADDNCWILYFHGNNANLTSRGNVTRFDQLRSLGLNVFAPEYPGYGPLAGVPTEQNMMAAGRAAYVYLRDEKHVPAERLIIYGWSLGSGVAIPIASETPQAALIVEGAFTSVLRRAQALYPYLPITLMVHNPFLSEDHMPGVHAPVLVMHSPEDTIVPFPDGRKLYGLVTGPKAFVELRGGHITPNLEDEDTWLGGISGFLRTHTGCRIQEPRRSIGRALDAMLRERGLDAAIAEYRRISTTPDRDRYNLAAYELTYLASRLEERGRAREAQAIRGLASGSAQARTAPDKRGG